MNIDNQYLTLSAFYKDGNFLFFEAGFRLSGEMSFNYYRQVSGCDYLEEMIRYAMGDADIALLPQCDCTQLSSVILNYFIKDGVIREVKNKDIITSLPDVCDFLMYVNPGEKICNSTGVLKKSAMCTIFSDDIMGSVRRVNQLYGVYDENGKYMIYERVQDGELE